MGIYNNLFKYRKNIKLLAYINKIKLVCINNKIYNL